MRNFKVIIFIAVLFSIISAFSCNSSDTKSKINEKKSTSGDNFNQYFPLKDGNTWKYVNEGPRDETELYLVKATEVKKVEGGIQMKVSTFPYLTKDNVNRSITIKTNSSIEINDYMGSSGVIIPAEEDSKTVYKWTVGIFRGYINIDNDNI